MLIIIQYVRESYWPEARAYVICSPRAQPEVNMHITKCWLIFTLVMFSKVETILMSKINKYILVNYGCVCHKYAHMLTIRVHQVQVKFNMRGICISIQGEYAIFPSHINVYSPCIETSSLFCRGHAMYSTAKNNNNKTKPMWN